MSRRRWLALAALRAVLRPPRSSRCAPRSTRARSASRTSSSSRSRSRAAARPTRSRCPPLANLRRGGGALRVDPGLVRQRPHVAVAQPHLRAAAARAWQGRDRRACRLGGRTSTAPIAIEVVAGAIRPAEPPRQDPFGGIRSATPSRTIFGATARSRGRAAAADGGGAVAHSAPRGRAAAAHLLALHADLGRRPPVQGGAAVRRLLGRRTSSARRRRPRASRPRSKAQSYRRFPVLRKLLFPTKAGTLTIPASRLPRRPRAHGLLRRGRQRRARRRSPCTITVEPLPDAPGFAGAVGRFRPRRASTATPSRSGEAATLRFRVEGTGNLKWIDRGPELAVPGAKVYPPQAKSDLRTTPEGIVRLPHLGVRGRARDERRRRDPAAGLLVLRSRGRTHRDVRDGAAVAARRGRDGWPRVCRRPRRPRRRLGRPGRCRCAPISTGRPGRC